MRWITGIRWALQWVKRARNAALTHSRERADAGDPEAQYALGERYHDGLGVARDRVQALAWFFRAAEQGHARAQLTVGMMLFLGRGCAPDKTEAVKWLTLALENGELKARAPLTKLRERLPAEVFEEGTRQAAAYTSNSKRP